MVVCFFLFLNCEIFIMLKSMRIILTGATGLLGRPLMKELAAIPKSRLSGISRSRTGEDIVNIDLLDLPAAEEYLRKETPGVIIHLAAERRPDQFDRNPEASRRLNVDAVAAIARTARDIGAWMLYLSTDYVFDGSNPPYAPGDAPNPLNSYGQSKYEGELALWSATNRGAVLRVPLLYGPVEYPAESPVTALIETAKAGGEADDWQQRYPTFTPDLARVIRRMIEISRDDEFLTGTFHWSGNEVLTKYDMVRLIAEYLGQNTAEILPLRQAAGGAPRPHDTRLDCSALESRGCDRRTPFAEGLRAALESLGSLTEGP
jgi:dTDP-4-dehydrorhamnose reductase